MIQNYINVYSHVEFNGLRITIGGLLDRRKSIYKVFADITKSSDTSLVPRAEIGSRSTRERREKRSCERHYRDTLYNGPSESPSVNLSQKISWRTRRRYSAGDKSPMNRERERVGPMSSGRKSRAARKEKKRLP